MQRTLSHLTLPRPLVNTILAQAQHSPEAEICGLIGGKEGHAWHCYPVSNCAANPAQRYVMNPKGQIDTLRQMRECGEELVAIYHSHPHTAATPSLIDLQEAQYPDTPYLIISLNTQGVLEIAAFRLDKGTVSSIQISLE
ncbi:MAG: M67 family metallopeptidase [Gammaproteobacteria bacterium]|nr:M67 family metallopeptidase [Gammaproteobacteria bacterium]